MESYSLFQLNEYIRRVIALNFREPVWIEAEIVQIKETRGHFYLELVEKKENSTDIIAQASAAIWYRNYQFIKKKLGKIVNDILVTGTQVRLKCRVDFNERYGFKLFIEDVDPNFTFGQMEIKRQKIIEQLQSEGLMDLNSSIPVPAVIQSVAVISSASAAGFKDFVSHIQQNIYGYTFHTELFEASVQGQKVEKETLASIESIKQRSDEFDLAIIIRGGGSKLDLSGYDNYEIAKAIATADLPFVIGIGHDIDSTVVDLVACLSLKTPTAVADFMVETNLLYESKCENTANTIFQISQNICSNETLQIRNFAERLAVNSQRVLSDKSSFLDRQQDALAAGLKFYLAEQNSRLDRIKTNVKAHDPHEILQKGFAYITKNQQHLKSVKSIKKKDLVDIHFHDGNIQSQII